MNQVKQQMTIALLTALSDANMADVTDAHSVNDLQSINCEQSNLYGYLSDSLDCLGHIAQEARELYIDTGSLCEAILFVNEQYTLLAGDQT